MPETVSEALVLGFEPARDRDAVVDLFVRDRGRVRARVVGGRRPLSKFAPHLDPLSLVTVRLVSKRSVTVADAVTTDRFPVLRRNGHALHAALEVVYLLRQLLPGQASDTAMFDYLVRSFRGAIPSVGELLVHLGYDPRHAACDRCHAAPVGWFAPDRQRFFCAACAVQAGGNAVSWVRTRA